jgi:hypothetical protein
MNTVCAKLPSGVVVLGSRHEGKACFIASVSDDLVTRGVHAGHLIGLIAKIAGGGGGGQPNRAQAGGRDAAKVGEAVRAASEILAGMLNDNGMKKINPVDPVYPVKKSSLRLGSITLRPLRYTPTFFSLRNGSLPRSIS